MAVYVCSDIHGKYDAWMRLIKRSNIDLNKGDKLIILGDLIDRGDKSLECVKYALKLKSKYPNQVIYLMGNHEQMMLNFLNSDLSSSLGFSNFVPFGKAWTGNGGVSAIQSFLGAIPNEGSMYDKLKVVYDLMWKRHGSLIQQLNELPYYHLTDRIVFVHAGFKSNTPLIMQDEDTMVWIRDEFFNHFKAHKGDVLENKLIIHGHTPVPYINGYNGEGYYKGKHHLCIDGGSAMNRNILLLKIDGNKISYDEEAVV